MGTAAAPVFASQGLRKKAVVDLQATRRAGRIAVRPLATAVPAGIGCFLGGRFRNPDPATAGRNAGDADGLLRPAPFRAVWFCPTGTVEPLGSLTVNS